MKHFYLYFLLILLCLSALRGHAQVPEGYYDAAMGLTGENLKAALHEIIKDHLEFPYTSTAIDTWDILKETDKDILNADNVVLFYSGRSVNAAQEYNSGKGWSREAVWANTHGDFGTSKGAGTDVHHLRPVAISVNRARSSKDFDDGGDLYIDADGPTTCRVDADSWEPGDAIKGDVARMLFYMAVRYEGDDDEPDLELIDGVNTADLTEPSKGFHGKLTTLLQWHAADPVDSSEINRNNIIFSYQQNRNPFIDHPEFVNRIWMTTAVKVEKKEIVTVWPNPVTSRLTIKLGHDKKVSAKLVALNGNVVKEFEIQGEKVLSVKDLDAGCYLLKVEFGGQLVVKKITVNT